MSNQRSPWWPYLFVMAGLFVMSIAVPHRWQRAPKPERSEEHWSRDKNFRVGTAASKPIAVVRPAAASGYAAHSATLPPEENHTSLHVVVEPATAPAPAAAISFDSPWVEAVGKAIAEFRRFSEAAATEPKLAAAEEGQPATGASQPITTIVSPPSTVVVPPQSKVVVPARSSAEPKQPSKPDAMLMQNETAAKPRSLAPQSLMAQLDRLSKHPEYRAWALQVKNQCLQWDAAADADPARAREIANKLQALYKQSDALAKLKTDEFAAAELRQAQYSLERRLLIWIPALAAPTEASEDSHRLVESTDLRPLLSNLESYESSGSTSDARRLEAFAERLKGLNNKSAQQLAKNLDQIYRNANFRVAITNELLKRMAGLQDDATIRDQTLTLLGQLELETECLWSDNSSGRLTLRLRLAGADQLGGYTARPQAPSDSQASAQLHESAINNALDRLELGGRTFTLAELRQTVADRLGLSNSFPPSDMPAISITFAKQNPIHVRCDNGTLELTAEIEELRQEQRVWKHFAITATYVPQIEGMHVWLTKSGSVEVKDALNRGPSELALVDLCNQAVSTKLKPNLIPHAVAEAAQLAGLNVTQCVIEDGWIGLALGPAPSSGDQHQVAQRSSAQ